MYTVSARFLDALRASHVAVTTVESWQGATLLATDLPISAGAVTVDGGSEVRRTLSLTVSDPTLDPGTDPAAVLSPYGADLVVRRGIRFPDGTVELVPLGRFRIEQVDRTLAGDLQVAASDRTAVIKDARFTAIAQSNTANTIPAEISRLITEALTVAVSNRSGSTAGTPTVYWEQDRWAAIEDLASSIGCVVYFDPDGTAVIATTPAITDPAVWWVDAGEAGVMVSGRRQTSREQTYNGVVASGESSGDTLPYTATVTDNDPASPTYWNGPFGKKPRFYVSPLITTQAQATAAAASMLGRVKGMARQLTLSCVPNPALESGDVIRVRFPDGSTETHLVDAFEVPLDADNAMNITTRSENPALE